MSELLLLFFSFFVLSGLFTLSSSFTRLCQTLRGAANELLPICADVGLLFSTIPTSASPNGGHLPLCQPGSEQTALMSAWRAHRGPQRRACSAQRRALVTIWKTMCSLRRAGRGWIKMMKSIKSYFSRDTTKFKHFELTRNSAADTHPQQIHSCHQACLFMLHLPKSNDLEKTVLYKEFFLC